MFPLQKLKRVHQIQERFEIHHLGNSFNAGYAFKNINN